MRRENELFSNTMHVAFYKVSQVTTVRNKPVANRAKSMHLLQQGGHSPEETWLSHVHRTWGEVEARQGTHTGGLTQGRTVVRT